MGRRCLSGPPKVITWFMYDPNAYVKGDLNLCPHVAIIQNMKRAWRWAAIASYQLELRISTGVSSGFHMWATVDKSPSKFYELSWVIYRDIQHRPNEKATRHFPSPFFRNIGFVLWLVIDYFPGRVMSNRRQHLKAFRHVFCCLYLCCF